jgi:hypothetical protein
MANVLAMAFRLVFHTDNRIYWFKSLFKLATN